MSNIANKLASLRELAKPGQIVNVSDADNKHENFETYKYNKNTPPDGTLTKIKLLIQETNLSNASKVALLDKVDQGIIDDSVIDALRDAKAVTPFGTVELSSEDIKWLQDQAKVADDIDFESWFATKYHFGKDGMHKAFAAKMNPSYYQDRLAAFNKKLALIAAVKKLQLLGPQNEDDLILQWALEQGRIKLDKNWDKIGITAENAVTPTMVKNNVRNGRLNSRLGRWVGQDNSNRMQLASGQNSVKTGLPSSRTQINKYGSGASDLMIFPSY